MRTVLSLALLALLTLTACTSAPRETQLDATAPNTSVAFDGTPLTQLQHQVLWEEGTERSYDNEYHDEKREGLYVTRGCGIPVFTSKTKYDSRTGWPSFWAPLTNDSVVLKEDKKLLVPRTEVESSCGEHLGHVFSDGPEPTGLRYCMNSASLVFIPLEELTDEQRALYEQSS